MCGINGFNFTDKALLQKMNQQTKHRGPDFSGEYYTDNLSLGHNLLAIREVSHLSKQPYHLNPNWVLAFNGQIYNTEKLKKHLQEGGIKLEPSLTNLDTYILYQMIELYGFDFAPQVFGMFAIALFNHATNQLALYRDSSGQKNLYYYFFDKKFIFSSEIKAILQNSHLNTEVDEEAVHLALSLGYIPGNKTLFKHIKKLQPSEQIIFDLHTKELKQSFYAPQTKNYFELDPAQSTEENFSRALKKLLAEHLQSKDKVSINLSGGLDSSLLLHEASRNNYPVDSYTTSFVIENQDPKTYNQDAELANQLAQDYKTNHREIKITKQDYLENLIESYKTIEEPNYNISIPIYYLTAKTEGLNGDRKRVVLSGDGGDEIFAGYPYYLEHQKIDKKIKRLTPFLYALISYLRSKLSGKKYINNLNIVERWMNMKKLAKIFLKKPKIESNSSAYLQNIFKVYRKIFSTQKKTHNHLYLSMLMDRCFWMAGENFVRSDKLYASQAMEMRCPLSYEPFRNFCDELIPEEEYINQNDNKLFLRKYANKVLPAYIVNRPNKTGWRAPVELWYDESYKDRFLSILTEAKNLQSEKNGIIEWDQVIDELHKSLHPKTQKPAWPGKWIHIYLSLAILSKEYNLKI